MSVTWCSFKKLHSHTHEKLTPPIRFQQQQEQMPASAPPSFKSELRVELPVDCGRLGLPGRCSGRVRASESQDALRISCLSLSPHPSVLLPISDWAVQSGTAAHLDQASPRTDSNGEGWGGAAAPGGQMPVHLEGKWCRERTKGFWGPHTATFFTRTAGSKSQMCLVIGRRYARCNTNTGVLLNTSKELRY